MAFFAQTTANFGKYLIITLVFEKNAISFSENLLKSQKIVLITYFETLSTMSLRVSVLELGIGKV
jgi:hypothetical protein